MRERKSPKINFDKPQTMEHLNLASHTLKYSDRGLDRQPLKSAERRKITREQVSRYFD